MTKDQWPERGSLKWEIVRGGINDMFHLDLNDITEPGRGFLWTDGYNEGYTLGERSAAARVEFAVKAERDRIIEVIANVPVTVRFEEPVTKIDLLQYHADIVAAIQRSSR